MNIGLYDADGHNFPSLPLMKISAFHKSKGDNVEFAVPIQHYDRVYISRVFGDEYTTFDNMAFNADEVIYGGTGFAIKVENGREVYRKTKDVDLPAEIEHIYPDYSLYPQYTKDTAYGFLTRGCPNNCGFCIVSKKEGMESIKVADLSEFWNGQKNIKLMDANLLACRERVGLLRQLIDSHAWVDFTQGLDARFLSITLSDMIADIKIKRIHFAFDSMRGSEYIIDGLKIFKERTNISDTKAIVYVLVNYNTTWSEDLYRINVIRELGYLPDVRIYRKESAPQFCRDLQRWCNNRILYRSCDFKDYIPRKKDGRTIAEIYRI